MSNPAGFYVQRNGTELGPLTIAQVNRMKQRREIGADTPCRAAHEAAFRRLDEVLPHLKDQQRVAPEKIAKLKQDIATHETGVLIKMGFGAWPFFWVPFFIGVIAASTAIGCGGVLLFKHRKPIGLVPMFLGALGLVLRFSRYFE